MCSSLAHRSGSSHCNMFTPPLPDLCHIIDLTLLLPMLFAVTARCVTATHHLKHSVLSQRGHTVGHRSESRLVPHSKHVTPPLSDLGHVSDPILQQPMLPAVTAMCAIAAHQEEAPGHSDRGSRGMQGASKHRNANPSSPCKGSSHARNWGGR